MPELISRVKAESGRIQVRASKEFSDRYLVDDFVAEYEPEFEDLPEEIAVIPFILNVAPIAILSGEEWTVPALDREFAVGLEELPVAFASGHPDQRWTGAVTATRTIETPTVTDPDAYTHTALFSGGVDSVHAAIGHRHQRLQLVTVHGADIALWEDDSWKAVRAASDAFAADWGMGTAFVRSNFRTFIDIPKVEKRFGIAEWWHDIQHGIGLIGLAAPVVPRITGARMIIASTLSRGYSDAPSGSTAIVDEKIRWGPVTVDHYGDHLNRTGKALEVARWTADAGMPAPNLRVCFGAQTLKGRNCMRCEKCLRTAVALTLTGGSVTQLSEGAPAETTLKRVRSATRWYRLPFSEHHISHWRELQERAAHLQAGGTALEPPVEALVDWLLRFDLTRYAQRRRPIGFIEHRVTRLLRRYPWLDRVAKTTRGMVKRLRR